MIKNVSVWVKFFVFSVLAGIIIPAVASFGQAGQVSFFPNSNNKGFGFSIATDRAIYHPQQPITITLAVFNYTDKPITFVFSDSQRYDFIIRKKEAKIWQWSSDKFFAQVIGKEEIEPGRSLFYKQTYTPREKLSPGEYSITGILTCRENPLQARIYFEVTE